MEIEKHLWTVVDQLRANSHLRASDYSIPVLGLIFLNFADEKFQKVHQLLEQEKVPGNRSLSDASAYHAHGAIFLEREARYDYLLSLTDGDDRGEAVNKTMRLIEEKNPDLRGALPIQGYTNVDNLTLGALLRDFSIISFDPNMEGDLFGRIYEYFLSKFAFKEGQHGGEFYTPTSLVKLIVEIIEPFRGLILDPACGSGGMFVQSAQFVQRHNRKKNLNQQISIYGQEKAPESGRLCKMNLAVHGLSGAIRQGNSYYEDYYCSCDRFDYVMANPPWNVKSIEKTRLLPNRYPFGIPRVNNGNYLWIQLFYSALKETGRAGFVMPNGASSAGGSEQKIRQRLIEDRVVDVMISVGSHFFYTATVPCTLWFFDKGKRASMRRDTVLFIDARDLFHQVDRVHREFTPQQIEYLANIVRLYRDEHPEYENGSQQLIQEHFPEETYADVAGCCKVANMKEIAEREWSLNPGLYIEAAESANEEKEDFETKMRRLYSQLKRQNEESQRLNKQIEENMSLLLGEGWIKDL